MANVTDNIVVEGLSDILSFRTQASVLATSASTLTLTTTSPWTIIFTGTTAGQIVDLQDATTISVGYQQSIQNNSTQSIAVNDATNATPLITLTPGQRVLAILQVAGTIAGTWSLEFMASAATSIQYTTLMQGLDDLQYVDGNLAIGHSPLGFIRANTGTGALASISTTPVDNHSWGVITFTTGTTATGRCNVSSATATPFQLGDGILNIEFRVNIPVLSTATQRFTFYAGFMDGTAAGQPTNGIYFMHTDTVNGGNWTLRSVSATSASTCDSTILPVINTWYRIRFEYVSTSLVNCYINDALLGTIISNIPTTTIYTVIKQEKSVGTTARLAYLDSLWWRMDRI
jgi:hypothetical protein